MPAINNIHHHPLSSDETSKTSPPFPSLTLLGSHWFQSLANWPGNQSMWETPGRSHLLPSTPGRQPQKLKQVWESRQVREAVSDHLMLGVPEFSGLRSPVQLSVTMQNLPSVCHIVSKSMVLNGSQCWQAVTVSENSLLLGLANTSTNHFMLISTLNLSVKNTGLILKIWVNSF